METLTREDYGVNKSRNVLCKKEHITIVDMENKTFVGDFTTESGKGKVIAEGVKAKINENKIPLDNISIISGDSTNSNTGYKDGSFPWFEELSGKAFHWFVCVCHLAELPLCKVVQWIVGETAGPGAYESDFGQQLQNIETNPNAVKFKKIVCE